MKEDIGKKTRGRVTVFFCRFTECFIEALLFFLVLLRAWKGIAINGELGIIPQIIYIAFTPVIPVALIGCCIAQWVIIVQDEFFSSP